MTTETRAGVCGAAAADYRQALLLCSDVLACSHAIGDTPAAAKTLLLALRSRQAGSTPAASGRLGAPPPQ